MKTSINGLNLIKKYEGLSLKAYRCPAGILTIGYGHTGNVREGQEIDESEATYMLKLDLADAERAVNRELPEMTQNQFDALVSFVYNLGSGSFGKSTLLKKAKINPFDNSIADEFRKWTKASGRELPGLVRRRDEEAKLYFS